MWLHPQAELAAPKLRVAQVHHAGGSKVVCVVVAIRGPAAAARLGGASSRHGSDAAIDNDALLIEVLAKELALTQGVLIYAFPFMLLLPLRSFAVGLPVPSAVRKVSPYQTRRGHSLFLPPDLEAKE
jgi:hypothetical protein